MPRAKKPTDPAAPKAASTLLERHKDFEGISVIERRLQYPELPGSVPIRLKDEPSHLEDPHGKKRKWYLRWINGGVEGRTSTVTDFMGYVPVRVEDLQNPRAIAGLSPNSDGMVRRGDKGQEWLAKMPLELYNAIKAKQIESRKRRERNATLVKEDLANIAGNSLGSEAGDTVHEDFRVEVAEKERTTALEELADNR